MRKTRVENLWYGNDENRSKIDPATTALCEVISAVQLAQDIFPASGVVLDTARHNAGLGDLYLFYGMVLSNRL